MSVFPDPQHRASSEESAVDLLPLMFLAASPLLFWLLTGSTGAALGAIFHLGLMSFAIFLIRRGCAVEARYKAAQTARKPKVPRKILGSMMLGVSALLLAASHFATWTPPLAFGAAACLLSLLAFGIDPMRDKGFDDPALMARQAALRGLAKTDAALGMLVDRVARLEEPFLTLRMEAVRSAILRLVRAHAASPEGFASFEKPLATFVSIAEAEVVDLEQNWATHSHRAAQRFTHRMVALTDGFEARARKRRARTDADDFAFDTDLLLDRMRENKAA